MTGNDAYADVARGVLRYVLRDMMDESGGFHSAEDADSLPFEGAKEKKEVRRENDDRERLASVPAGRLESWAREWPISRSSLLGTEISKKSVLLFHSLDSSIVCCFLSCGNTI